MNLQIERKIRKNSFKLLSLATGPLGSIFSYYIFFCLLFMIVHYSLISLVAFFHFLLGHQLSAISDWTLRYGWQILSLAKMMALYFAFKVFHLRTSILFSFKSFFQFELYFPNLKIFVVLIYLFLFMMWLGRPVWIKDHFNAMCIWFQCLSFFGTSFFYLSDILILYLARTLHPLQKANEKFIFLASSTLICIGLNYAAIPFIQKFTFFPVLHLVTCLIFFELKKAEIGFSLLYIFLFIAPLNAFFGFDPLWGHTFSIFRMEKESPLYLCLGLWGLAFLYLFIFEGSLKDNSISIFVRRKKWRKN